MRISDWSSDVCSSDLNLARYIRELDRPCAVARNDAVTLADIARLAPSHIIVSPGPCTPKEAGISNAVIDRKSVVSGKSVSVRVDLGGCRILKKKNNNNSCDHTYSSNR